MRTPHQTLAALGLGAALLFALPSAAQARFPVIGYFTSWTGDVASIQFDKLTHINYSFANTDAAGNISVPNTGRLADLIDRAHAKGVKVGLAVGGWQNGNNSNFEQMAANATSRANFVRNLVAWTDEGLDGIDMDWEYPNASSASNYALMMNELGAALKAKGKYLSAAVIAQGDWAGAHIRASVFQSVDFLNIMAYDATHLDHHASYELAEASIAYWVANRGLPRHKAVLGVPFYGRSIRGGDQYVAWKDLVAQNPSAAQTDVAGGLYFNGIPTIQRKCDLAYQKAGGIMIWELGLDAPGANSLLSAIGTKAATYPSTSLRPAGSRAMPRLSLAAPGLLRLEGGASALRGGAVLRLRSLDGRALPGGLAGIERGGAAEFRFDPAGLAAGSYLAEIVGAGSRLAVPLLIP